MSALNTNCIFCKIVNGTISARIIDQNDKAVAFLDAFPLSAGHTLIIPKLHYSKVQDMDKEYLCAVFDLLRIISAAVEKALEVELPPVLLTPLRWFEEDRPDFYQKHVVPLMARYDLV